MSVPGNKPVAPIKSATSGVSNQAGKELQLYAQDSHTGRDLMSVLKPGDVLHGRVVEQFGNGDYLFTIRGRNLIASSTTPLMRDSVYPFEVLQTTDGLLMRLINGESGDQASTSNLHARLQQLNLPSNALSQMLLQHFEQAGAALNTDRLQHALQALQLADPEQQPFLAASHALLAKHGLPTTPALLHLAQTSITQQGHSVQQSLPVLQQSLPQLLNQLNQTQAANQSNYPSGQVQLAPQTTNSSLTIQNPAAALPQHVPADMNMQSSASTADDANASSAKIQPNPSLNLGTSINLNSGTHTTQSTFQQAINQYMHLHNPLGAAPAQLATLQLSLSDGLRSLDSSNAIERALQANGIYAAADSASNTSADKSALKSMLQEIAQLSHVLQQQNIGGATNNDAKHMLRELSADIFFKPQHLTDYDSVLPLVLQQHGQAQQARLAIAKRSVPGQQMSAVFLRVDLELKRLGPLSLRMSSGHGPIVITIFGVGRTIQALQNILPSLNADLEKNHIEAHVRIADLIEHQESLHG